MEVTIMKLSITARHYKAPGRLKGYLEKKIKKLEKFYNGIVECEAIFSYEKLNQIIELKIKVYGTTLIVKESSDDIFKSIDLGVDKLERQLKKYKDKLRGFEHEKHSEGVSELY
jgi:putative sigma-54 modulation protein